MSQFKRLQMGILVFQGNRLEPRVLSWQQHSRCHSVSFAMYISCAKLEEHCSNISGDILDSVFYCSIGTIYGVITFLICIIQKRNMSKTKKDIPKRKTPFFFILKSLSNKAVISFYFMGL